MTRDRGSGYPERRAELSGEHLADLVELFEYRVADALRGQRPRGGRRSLADLREELLSAPLEPALYRRVLDADCQFRAYQQAAQVAAQATQNAQPPNPQVQPPQVGDPRAPASFTAHSPPAWEARLSGESAQARAWHELRLLAWGDAARAALQSRLPAWYREPTLLTLRVLYTALENAERVGQAGLCTQTSLAVPARHDPLTDLDDPQILQALIEAVVALLIQPGGRGRLEAALSQVRDTPFPRHPDDDVLRARVAAAEREPLAPQARQSLIQALHDHAFPPRDPRERPAIREAARNLAQSLQELLGSAPQATLGGVPSHSVLYAAQSGAALRTPDDGAAELVVRLAGSHGMHWRGVDFRWQSTGQTWQVQAGDQTTVLRPQAALHERHTTLSVNQTQFRAFVSGGYMLLRVQTTPHQELTRLASLGRAVSLLLDPAEDYAALRLARAAAQQWQQGRVDAAALSPSSAAKYPLASSNALLNFARKGAEALCAHLTRLGPADLAGCLSSSAQALNLRGHWDDRLAAALITALHRLENMPVPLRHSRIDLPPDGSALCVELRDDPPLTLHFGERAVTLRHDFHREWAVLLPGHAPMTLQDLTVVRASGFSLILARHGDWLTAAAEPAPESDEEGQQGQG